MAKEGTGGAWRRSAVLPFEVWVKRRYLANSGFLSLFTLVARRLG